MKKLILIIFLLLPAVLFGQRTFIEGLIIGSGGDTVGSAVILNDTTLRFTVNDTIYDLSSGNFLFVSDTAAMLASYINRADTASMLLTYINKSDTASMLIPYALLSEAILPADTAAMLATYINKADTSAMLSNYAELSEVILPADTAAMLVTYINKSDTAAMLLTYINKADTAAMLSNYAELTEIVDWEITGAEDIHSDRIQDNLIDHDNLLNFLASEHVVYVGGNGITRDGTDIDLGGALDAPTTITGTELNYIDIKISDAGDRSARLVFRPADGLSMRAYTGDDYTGDSGFFAVDSATVIMAQYDGAAETSIRIDTANSTGGILITDEDIGRGITFYADYSAVAENLDATPKIYQDLHLGGQTLNSTIYSPTADEHGDVMTWDSLNEQYVSTNTIPLSQSTGAVLYAMDTILFSNTLLDTIVTLSVASVIKDIQVYIGTAFNGSGTDLLDVGISTDTDKYENDLDMSDTSFEFYGLSNVPSRMASTTYITFQYTDSGADASAGFAIIYVYYTNH